MKYDVKFGYKAAIFDFDGTIMDSMGFWNGLYPNYIKRYGRSFGGDFNPQFYQLQLEDAAEMIQKQYFPDFAPGRVYKEWQDEVARNYREVVLPKPGAEEYIKELRRQGVGTCIATLTDKQHINIALDRIGWHDIFDFVLTVEEAGATKDFPDIFIQCADRFGLTPAECCVFEDSPGALSTVAKAGFGYICVLDPAWDFRGRSFCGERRFREYDELLNGSIDVSPQTQTAL